MSEEALHALTRRSLLLFLHLLLLQKKAKGEPKDEKKKPTFKVRTLLLDSIEEISAVRIFMPEDTHPEQARKNVGKSVKEVCKRFPEPEGLPMLDPVNDMKIKSSEFEKSLEKVEKLTKEVRTLRCKYFTICFTTLSL